MSCRSLYHPTTLAHHFAVFSLTWQNTYHHDESRNPHGTVDRVFSALICYRLCYLQLHKKTIRSSSATRHQRILKLRELINYSRWRNIFSLFATTKAFRIPLVIKGIPELAAVCWLISSSTTCATTSSYFNRSEIGNPGQTVEVNALNAQEFLHPMEAKRSQRLPNILRAVLANPRADLSTKDHNRKLIYKS